MASSEESNASQLTVIDTEHTIFSPTTAEDRIFWVEGDLLQDGDILEVRAYKKDGVAGTDYEIFGPSSGGGVFANSGHGAIATPPMSYPFGGKWTIKQTAGSVRTFQCHLDKLA